MKKIFIAALLFLSSVINAQEAEGKTMKQSDLLLIQPISVTIGGFFIVNGSFTSAQTERLDHFITALFLQAKERALSGGLKPEVKKQLTKEIDQFALRDITLKRATGEILKIDLMKFRLTGDFKYNPYLKQDDVIIFPAYDSEKNVINIVGAVNKPTTFQFVQGDKLSDAIQFAGGLNTAYEGIQQAEISRLDKSGTKEELIKVNIKDDYVLTSGDRVKILADENEKKDYKVLVLGQVNNPGYVFITKDGMPLKEIIKKAGGFKSDADLKRSELLRSWDQSQMMKMKAIRDIYERDSSFTTLNNMKKVIEELQTEELKFYRTSNITEDELRTSFNVDNYLRFIENKSVIDFTKIDSDTTNDGEFIVKEGDIIVIPEKQDLVYIFGQIANPGYQSFESGKDYKHYIKKAGGLTQQAKDEDEIQIIKGQNKAWFNVEEVKSIEPGDLIYIPKKVPRDPAYFIQQISTVTSIVSSVVSLIFIIIVSTK